MLSVSDYRQVGALLQWGLDVSAYPGNQAEYAALLRRYINDGEFRDAARHTALGLGLQVLDASENGIVLAPTEKSLFRVRMADVRNSAGADDRLLEGFIHVAIAAAVFPRTELIEDPTRRAAITVQDVEELIRRLCIGLEASASGEADPTRDELSAGLIAGWRVYQSRVTDADTTRRVGAPTTAMIRKTLLALADAGMFVVRQISGVQAFQPTYRYQTQVREFAANEAYRLVRNVLDDGKSGEIHA